MPARSVWVSCGGFRAACFFVYGALSYDKPFRGPLFAFVSLHHPGSTQPLPLYVKLVLGWLRERFQARRLQNVGTRSTIQQALMRVDAKAEGLSVGVGGLGPLLRPRRCH